MATLYNIDKQKVAERIKRLIRELDIKNSRQFALSIGMDTSYLNKVINATVQISDKYAEAIQHTYNISKEWLLHGKGDMKAVTLNQAAEEELVYLKKANPFKRLPTKEWAVIELIVQELAVDRSKQTKRPFLDCLEELYAKIDLVLNAVKDV